MIEGLAVSYLELDFAPAIADWERAYAAHRDAGDRVGAVRVARTLAYMYGAIVGDWAVMSGWLARAQTLLGDDGRLAPRRGWVALNRGHVRGRPRAQGGAASARRSTWRAGSATPTSSSSTLAYLGASLVHADRTEEGMVLLDEALAAVAGSEVDDFCVLEEIFCQLFSACEHAHDVDARRSVDPDRRGDRRAAATSRRCRRSAARTTAACSPPPGAGPRPTPR